jgi:TRAP-type C4-dicarboxylate transport system permease small subunit
MEKARKILDVALLSILVFQGFFLIFVIVLAVFYRYILGSALSWPEEFAGILFVWYTLLGIVVLVGSDSHIAFDIVEKYAPPIAGLLVKILSQLIIILYGIIMIVYGWQYLRLFPYETSPAAGINLTWVKVSIPVTGALLVVYVTLNIIQTFKANRSEKGGAL